MLPVAVGEAEFVAAIQGAAVAVTKGLIKNVGITVGADLRVTN